MGANSGSNMIDVIYEWLPKKPVIYFKDSESLLWVWITFQFVNFYDERLNIKSNFGDSWVIPPKLTKLKKNEKLSDGKVFKVWSHSI